ncbi:MAG TPA: carboxypeptidase regulatory-like domain-containing protein [Xanthobacteraceae bacterium]
MLSVRLVALASLAALLVTPGPARAQATLSGQVTAAQDGALEGVLVSAKKAGGFITVTVVSDKDGHFAFPAGRLASGQYNLRIRAVGYDLEGPKTVEVAADQPTTIDLKLRKARNLAAQLSNTEWLMSVPGTDAQKSSLLNCVGCHTLDRPLSSRYTADELVDVLKRMAGYAQVSTPMMPQRLIGGQPLTATPEAMQKQAAWLATVNLSESPTHDYALKTLPRPSGAATRVVITEYDLPRPTLQPHDVLVDRDGIAWFSSFGEQNLGRFDPKTGELKEFPLPKLKEGAPTGLLDLERDRDGNLWLANMFQGAIHRFDRKTEKFQTFQVPPELNNNRTQINMVAADNSAVDGKVWTFDVGSVSLFRVDVASGKFEVFSPYRDLPKDSPFAGPPHGIYGIASDSGNNVYFTDFADRKASSVGRIDAKTGQVTLYPVPTEFARPRRVMVDAQDRFWFAEYRGNKVGVLDPKTGAIKEWDAPTPWSGPYHVDLDKSGGIWTAGMTSDRVVRFDPASQKTIEYLLPRETNVRRVFVDNSATPPAFWVGSNHGASIVRLEPLDETPPKSQ